MAAGTHDVRALVRHREAGRSADFLAAVADGVEWTVMGTHPLAGVYRGKAAFVAGTCARLGDLLQGQSVMTVRTVLACGDVAVVEMDGRATAKDGQPYQNVFCWILICSGRALTRRDSKAPTIS